MARVNKIEQIKSIKGRILKKSKMLSTSQKR